MQEKPSFPESSGLKINMSLSEIHFNFKQLHYEDISGGLPVENEG